MSSPSRRPTPAVGTSPVGWSSSIQSTPPRRRPASRSSASRGIEVRTADAGTTDAYDGAVPADLVVACGIFGNVSLDDIERTIRTLPSLCAPGAWVVWTRHPREPGVLPAIAEWFEASGFERQALVVDDDAWFGVGLHRLAAEPAPYTPGQQLFTFVR